MTLTDLKLRTLKFSEKVTLYPDGGGLYLRVSKTKMRWQLSIKKNGVLQHFYGGYYPEISLAKARKWASETRQLKESLPELSPQEVTLGFYVADYRKKMLKDKKKPATLKKYDLRTSKYLGPLFTTNIRDIDSKKILEILMAIEDKGKYDACRQVLWMTSSIFLRAKIAGIRQDNPCEGLSEALALHKSKSRAAVIDVYDFGQLLFDIDQSKSCFHVKSALQLSPLVVTRPGELRLVHEREIDFNRALWTIPAERMKMGEDLIVPLSKQALKIFEDLAAVAVSPHLFTMPNLKGRTTKKDGAAPDPRPFSEDTLRKELKNLGYYGAHMAQKNLPKGAKFHTPHGFRASFRTICDEVLEWRTDLLEAQLAHKVKDTNGRAYNRTKHIEKRMEMMQAWADFCDVLKTRDSDLIDADIKNKKGLI
nr:tyrosine-type recombinase/integrase [Bdellovibrio sp. CKG001]